MMKRALTFLFLGAFALAGSACDELDSILDQLDVDIDAGADAGGSDAGADTDSGEGADAGVGSDIGVGADAGVGVDTGTSNDSGGADPSPSPDELSPELERLFIQMERNVRPSCERDIECIDDYWQSMAECQEWWVEYLDYMRDSIMERNDPEGCIDWSLAYFDCSASMDSCGDYRAAEMGGVGCEREDEQQGQACRYR